MSGIFPLRQTVSEKRGGPRLVDLDDEVADDVFEALSAKTTRQIFVALHENPQAASDLARVTDTSLQNVQYHLEKLTDADLVEVVDTWYSERGTEMKVYAPTDESLVLFAGSDKGRSLRTLLKRVVGIIAALLPMSAVVGWLAGRVASRVGSGSGDTLGQGLPENMSEHTTGGSQSSDSLAVNTGEAGSAGGQATTPISDPSTSPAGDVVGIFGEGVDTIATVVSDPGVLAGLAFFAGGVLVLVALVVHYRRPDE